MDPTANCGYRRTNPIEAGFPTLPLDLGMWPCRIFQQIHHLDYSFPQLHIIYHHFTRAPPPVVGACFEKKTVSQFPTISESMENRPRLISGY